MREVLIRAEQDQAVPDAQLRQQCVDRAQLNTVLATVVAQAGRIDMVLPIRVDNGSEAKRSIS